MNTDILKNAGIDYDVGVKRFLGREQIYEKSLSKFTKDTTFPRIRDAFALGNTELLMAAAHEFKGMCGTIGLTSLYTSADTIVQLLRSAASEGEIKSAYTLLEAEYDRICNAIYAASEC